MNYERERLQRRRNCVVSSTRTTSVMYSKRISATKPLAESMSATLESDERQRGRRARLGKHGERRINISCSSKSTARFTISGRPTTRSGRGGWKRIAEPRCCASRTRISSGVQARCWPPLKGTSQRNGPLGYPIRALQLLQGGAEQEGGEQMQFTVRKRSGWYRRFYLVGGVWRAGRGRWRSRRRAQLLSCGG